MANDKRSEWREGWPVLVAAFLAMMVGWNFTLVVSGLFLKPMQADFGWSRTELSFGSLSGFVAAFLFVPVGLLIEKIGARVVAITGLITLSIAFLLFATLPPVRALYYPLIVLLSVAGSMTSSASLSRPVVARFRHNLGLAIGLMMSGASVSAVIAVPALSELIAIHGWRSGFLALAATTLVVGLPAILAWFREPSPRIGGLAPSVARASMRLIFNTSNFRKLITASAVAALPIGGFLGHLIPILSDRGLSPMQAAWLGSVFAGAVALGKLASGVLLDRVHPPRATATLLALASIGAAVLFFTAGSGLATAWVSVSVAMIGLAQGAEGDYILFFSMRLFGPAHYARLVSILALTIMLGMAAGGLIFAHLFDVTGSYSLGLGLSATLYLLSGAVFLSLDLTSQSDRTALRDA